MRHELFTLALICFVGACAPPSDGSEAASEETGECTPGVDCPCETHADCPEGEFCVSQECIAPGLRVPFLDTWSEELRLPAADYRQLVIGGNEGVNDNLHNRGDIEVLYAEGLDEIVVELQRFTLAEDQAEADMSFSRASLWAYAVAQAQGVSLDPSEACELSDASVCQLRFAYDGLFQPSRDGANIRVTLPRGWDGELVLATEDNLEEEGYPDRSDIRIDGLAGPLSAVLDAGRVELRLDPDYPHYVDCDDPEPCELSGLDPACGCTQFSAIEITTRAGAAADVVVDLAPGQTYAVELANNDPNIDPNIAIDCAVELDCAGFEQCILDPALEPLATQLAAAINHPGPPADPEAGIRLRIDTGACEPVDFVEGPADYVENVSSELRGNIRVCTGCT